MLCCGSWPVEPGAPKSAPVTPAGTARTIPRSYIVRIPRTGRGRTSCADSIHLLFTGPESRTRYSSYLLCTPCFNPRLSTIFHLNNSYVHIYMITLPKCMPSLIFCTNIYVRYFTCTRLTSIVPQLVPTGELRPGR